MNLPNGQGGGWGQSGGNRGFRDIEPACKPGPDFDSCNREQLVGSAAVMLGIALFVSVSGLIIWFIETDQWFVLRDKIRSWRERHRS